MKVHLIYASTTGNTEVVMEKVAEMLTQAGVENELHRSEITDFSVIRDNQYFVMGTSTWGHGIINPFFDQLLSDIKSNSMNGKVSAFIGLGDKNYEDVFFNKGVDILKDAFIASGGREIETALKIDGDPFQILETKVPYWTQKVITALKNVSAI